LSLLQFYKTVTTLSELINNVIGTMLLTFQGGSTVQ